MGKRRSWFAAVKKAITPASKENRNNSKRRGCFSRQRSVDLEAPGLEKAMVVQATPPPPPQEVKLLEAESEQNRHAYSVALVTAMAAEAAVAAANAAAEVVRLRAAAYGKGKTEEEIAAIKIQAAFRGYMARRVLRALRGLVRLKSVVEGKSVKRQAVSSLKCMQTVARLQSEIRARRLRMSEENSSIQRLIRQKSENGAQNLMQTVSHVYLVQFLIPRRFCDVFFQEFHFFCKSGSLRFDYFARLWQQKGDEWDERTRSKEQIEAEIQSRQEAAMRRERALAYAYSHQTRWATLGSANQTFVDPSSRGWGWSWLERWMAARPWEKVEAVEDLTSNGLIAAKTASGRVAQSPTSLGGNRPSTPKSRGGGRSRPPSPRGALGRYDDDLNSLNSGHSEQCRRRSVGGSSMRDDDSLASSTNVPGYMAYTESARARSRLPSPQRSETSISAKKRLSFSGSPARPRRPSTPARAGASP